MIYKLLIENTDNSQEIIEIESTGGYFGDGLILWDERVDGDMRNDITLGAMVRVGDTLEVNDIRKSQILVESLNSIKSQSLLRIDRDNDNIVDIVIGRRDTEYLQAEKQAREYVSAGYAGDTYPYVQSWADAKEESEKWAADNIIETAASWRALQADMRSKRLKAKEDIRSSTTTDQVDSIVSQWSAYIDIIKKQLGV